jgi:hypothetical protein
VVLRLKAIRDDMRAERDKLNPFELRTYLPRDVIDAKFKAVGAVKKEKNSHRMEPFIYVLLYHI